MPKESEIDSKFKELSKKLSKDESLSRELSQLAEVIDDITDIDTDTRQARWPYTGARPLTEASWRE